MSKAPINITHLLYTNSLGVLSAPKEIGVFFSLPSMEGRCFFFYSLESPQSLVVVRVQLLPDQGVQKEFCGQFDINQGFSFFLGR